MERLENMNLPVRIMVLASLAILMPIRWSQGAVVPRFSLEELLRSSEMIVQGRIARSWSAWDRGHKFIWTHYEVEVTETLKGPAIGRAIVSEPGGAVPGVRLGVDGSLTFVPGEEAVLCLYRTPIGYWRVYGNGQGKFSLVSNGRGEKRIHVNLPQARLLDAAGSSGTRVDAKSLNGGTLTDFKRLIRTRIVESPGKGT